MVKKRTKKVTKTTAARKKVVRKPAASARPRKSKTRRMPSDSKGLNGWITHTELASSDPGATKSWCAAALGWNFQPSFPSPNGEYHLFTYSDKGGGGIRNLNAGEAPGSTPYLHVANVDKAFAKAVAAGAVAMMSPETIMDGVRIALVRAPGGVIIGFSGSN
jgi:predicted enzyme related to lactoylglutathione lyase